MSEPKFTKGPWRIAGYAGQHDEAGANIVAANGKHICSAGHVFSRSDLIGWQEYNANAQLIVMSPRMFHALYDIRMNNAGTAEHKRGWDEALAILEKLGVTA